MAARSIRTTTNCCHGRSKKNHKLFEIAARERKAFLGGLSKSQNMAHESKIYFLEYMVYFYNNSSIGRPGGEV